MKIKGAVTLTCLAFAVSMAQAQVEVRSEAQLTASDGEHAPLWLNANKHGLSSTDKTSGYVRAGIFKDFAQDSTHQWRYGFGADVAVATGFTSTVVVQQAFADVAWRKGLLTLGSKERHLELKDDELSSGSQTLGINARPVPGAKLSFPDYVVIPGTKHWLSFKGHLFYGITTDDSWQKEFTERRHKYTEHTMLHTKAGFIKIGKAEKPLSVEMGLEMGCQYGGDTYCPDNINLPHIENEGGLSGMFRAFVPGGWEASDHVDYHNEMGNHVGSWTARINLDYKRWGLSVYADHFFEDQSQMFFLDYDGYGTGEKWDSWEHFNWMLYDLRDIQLGLELRLKQCKWVDKVVAEYLYTMYQSGPIYHDHTRTISDHIGGLDHYYSHSIYSGWQHWGQVMGNPLYRSPIYNDNKLVEVDDSRFSAWHIGISGAPASGLRYRLLATWQKGFGTYIRPYTEPRKNVSLLAEAYYHFPEGSALGGWSVNGAFALDRGKLLGDNTGVQLTIGKRMEIKKKNK